MLDNKHAFKRDCTLGINTTPFMTWDPSQGWLDLSIRAASAAFGDYVGVRGEAGLGRLAAGQVVESWAICRASPKRFSRDQQHGADREIPAGREFCVAVCGGDPRGRAFTAGNTLRLLAGGARFRAGELIFTSMDKKAITLDGAPGGRRQAELKDIAQPREVDLLGLGLQSLIRIDVVDSGTLHTDQSARSPSGQRA
jgi:hypothetical protein